MRHYPVEPQLDAKHREGQAEPDQAEGHGQDHDDEARMLGPVELDMLYMGEFSAFVATRSECSMSAAFYRYRPIARGRVRANHSAADTRESVVPPSARFPAPAAGAAVRARR